MNLRPLLRLSFAVLSLPILIFNATSAFAAAQTITFPPVGDRTFKRDSILFNGGYSTSGLQVTLTSMTPGVCVVATTLTGILPAPLPPYTRGVTSISTGICTLRASQDGDANFSPATPVEQSFNIAVSPQTIIFPEISGQKVGSRFELQNSLRGDTLYTTSSLRAFVVSLTPSTCTLGTLIADAPPITITATIVFSAAVGTCTLRASLDGNANYLPATPVEYSFNIAPQTIMSPQTITFPPISDMVDEGDRVLLVLKSGSASSGLPLTNVSLTPGVCQVTTEYPPYFPSPNPFVPLFVKALSSGVCTLRASQNGDANFSPATPVEQSFKITKIAAAPGKLTLSPNIINPRAGLPITLTALVRGVAPNGVVSFSSTPISDITNPTVPVAGCSNLPVSLLPAATNAAVATCTTIAMAGAHRYTASYANDAPNRANPATISTNSAVVGPLDYSDIWWAGAAESGWGITIAQKGLQQFNAFYVYDGDGKPVWYVMSGGTWNADFTRFSGALYQPVGSSFSSYDARRLQVGPARGNATITFTDANNAVFNYTLNGVTAQKNISRLKFGAPDVAPKLNVGDIWWAGANGNGNGSGNELENGWGVSISQQDRSLFASWYTYDADGKATWFVMSGGSWTGSKYTGELFSTSSSPWLGVAYDGAEFRTRQVGFITFEFIDANNATMETSVYGLRQEKTITRLAF